MKSIKISSKNLTKYDACILVTDHDKFIYKLIQKYSKLIDTRERLKKKNKCSLCIKKKSNIFSNLLINYIQSIGLS